MFNDPRILVPLLNEKRKKKSEVAGGESNEEIFFQVLETAYLFSQLG